MHSVLFFVTKLVNDESKTHLDKYLCNSVTNLNDHPTWCGHSAYEHLKSGVTPEVIMNKMVINVGNVFLLGN